MSGWRLLADCHSSTPIAPEAHAALDGGVLAPEAGRAAIAALIGSDAANVGFVGGVRGSLQLVLTALTQAYPARKHLVLSVQEAAVWLQLVENYRRRGFQVSLAPLDGQGRLDLVALERLLTPETLLVSVAWVAPDTGVVQPIAEVAALARQAGAFSHSLAANAVGYLPVDVATTPVDFLSFAGGTLYGPERTGVVYARADTDMVSFVRQEARLYEETHAAEQMAMGAAAEAAKSRLAQPGRLARLRDRLEQTILRHVPASRRLGPPGGERAPHMAAWAFEGIHGGALVDLLALDGIRLKAATACETPTPLPQGLEAQSLSPGWRFGTLTIGLPVDVEETAIEALATALPAAVARLRRRSPVARHLAT